MAVATMGRSHATALLHPDPGIIQGAKCDHDHPFSVHEGEQRLSRAGGGEGGAVAGDDYMVAGFGAVSAGIGHVGRRDVLQQSVSVM